MTRLAILFHRLGPYHHARLEAVARSRPLTAVEYSSVDHTYLWEPVTPSGAFRVATVFSGEAVGQAAFARRRSKIFEVLDDVAPSAVAIPGWSASASLIALDWCLRHRVPAIVMSESQESDASRNEVIEGVKKRVVRLFSAGLVGGETHARYLERLGVARERVSLGYDVVDNAHFAEGSDAARMRGVELRRELGLPERYFLASSRFVPKKNLERLLEAYAIYRRAEADRAWKLVLLGDGELRSVLLRRLQGAALLDDVLLPGFKQYSELPAYYGMAQAFVHASMVEQWGLVVNEAMAAGLPVLVSARCGCAGELVRAGVNGHVFDPYEPEELADRLAAFSSGKEDLVAMGMASREIIGRWTPERFAEGMRRAVAAAASHGSPPASVLDRLLLQGLAHR